LLFVALFPILLVSLLNTYIFMSQFSPFVKKNIEYDVDVFANNINQYIANQISKMESLKEDGYVRTLLYQQEDPVAGNILEPTGRQQVIDLLQAHGEEFPEVLSLTLQRHDNTIIASSDPREIGNTSFLPELDQTKLNQHNIIVSDVITSPLLQKGVPHLIIYMPAGQTGHLVEILDLSWIQPFTEAPSLLESCSRLVIDSQGALVIGDIATFKGFSAIFKEIQRTNAKPGMVDFDVGDIKRLGCYERIGYNGWMILTSVDYTEIIKPIVQGFPYLLLMVFSVILLIVLVLHLLMESFASPVQELIDGMHHVKNGDYRYHIEYHPDNDFNGIIKTFNDLMDHVADDTEKLKNLNEKLNDLTTNIPGGLFSCEISEGFPFIFLSNSYISLMGCENEENMLDIYGTLFINTILPADRERVLQALSQIEKHQDTAEFEFRASIHETHIQWINCTVRLVVSLDGRQALYGMAVDTTVTHLANEQLRKSNDRYRIIMEQTDDPVFEWDIAEKRFTSFSNESNWIREFGVPIDPHANLLDGNFLGMHPEDRERFVYEVEKLVGTHQRQLRIDVRLLKTYSGVQTYFWNRFRMSVIFDSENNPEKITGMILDIHSEKLEELRLIGLSQTDSLTGLLNRRGFESKISHVLACSSVQKDHHVLVMLDIDSFKTVNDTLGHLMGDSTLIAIAKSISGSFRSSDFTSRFGGDEFAVFLRDFPDRSILEDIISRLLKDLNKLLPEVTFKNGLFSCSAGIARYPQDGTSFNELYKHVDEALYEVKRSGKNGFAFVGETRVSIT